MHPETRYARSGDLHIAYQVTGSGPVDLVLVPGWVSNIEVAWEEPRLVYNPLGAFLPSSQADLEARFREELQGRYGIEFHRLFNIANMPIHRFAEQLRRWGKYEEYMGLLVNHFNPCTVEGLMCRTLLSVDWQGYLHDCDFHLARGIGLGGKRVHVSELDQLPAPGSPVATGDHCYACTAGSGFT